MSRRIGLVVTVIGLSLLCACPPPQEAVTLGPKEKDYATPLPPGMVALRKIDRSQWPDFSKGFYQRAHLEEAIRNSLDYLAKPSSQKYFPYSDISHDRAVASLERFLDILAEVQSPEQLMQAIDRDYECYQSVGYNGEGIVYYTGYYTPIFDGRKQRDGQFRYPLYSLPADLVKDEEGKTLGRRLADNSIRPYYKRREIESNPGLLSGLEIAWLKDPFEVYAVTVQGSAKLRLADGSLYELGYAANNGYDYSSIRDIMIQDGAISKSEASFQTMRKYFSEHPDQVAKYTAQNDRYVFFREAPGGPFGSINEPVLAFRSIATDKEIYPRACLAFLDTRLPRWMDGQVRELPFTSFTLDQDTGGAIRAAGRCDVYMGVGDQAEAIAGRTGAEGKLYYIFVKNFQPRANTAPAKPEQNPDSKKK